MTRSKLGMLVVALGLCVACDGDGDGGSGPVPKAPIDGIELRVDGLLEVGRPAKLTVWAIREDDTEEVVTEGVTFTSSDEEVATVDAAGNVTMAHGGEVRLVAQYESFVSYIDTRVTCDYPPFVQDIVLGRAMPALSWPAKLPNGDDVALALEDVYCDKEWRDVETITFVLSAGWCGPCNAYAQELAGERAGLESRGMRIFYVLGQDSEGEPCDTECAWEHLDRVTNGRIPGISMGDAETAPIASFVQNSSILLSWPSAWVVRRADMQIIATMNAYQNLLPLQDIAENPWADWSYANSTGELRHNCEPGDEEAGEPNDDHAHATPIGAGTHAGAICNLAPDLYEVQLDGPWKLELDFVHAVGDLDVFVWDGERNEPARFDGQVVGSSGSTDHEELEYQGRAIVGVVGFDGASAAYAIELTQR